MGTGYKRNLKIVAHVCAFLTVVAWGTSFISTKILMEDAGLSPIEVYVYRFALAYLLLLFVTFRKIFADNWRDELQLFFCGVCAGSLYYVLENYALQLTTAGNVSLLSSVSPLVTTALMALVLRARVGIGKVVGSIVAFAGVGFIIFSHGEGIEINPLGDLLALASSLSWSIYAIGVKRILPHYTPLFITRKLFIYGVLTALPLLLIQRHGVGLIAIFTSTAYISNMLFLVIFCSAAGYVLWNYAIKALGAVATNNYLYLQPLITMIVAFFVFGESISALGYVGCFLIIGGLVLSDKLEVTRHLHHLRK